jgi:hypothetical protein
MLDPQGWFYFQRHRSFTNRVPYVRWSQAHMLRAIASLLETTLETGKRASTDGNRPIGGGRG